MLELFSSEGCSSCPPADRWVSSLLGRPGLWTAFVPVAFHVTYWDYLGWKDPLGALEFTDRQRRYAAAWDKSPYTPGFVLDGREWRDAFGDEPLAAGTRTTPGVLTVVPLGASAEEVEATFEPAKGLSGPFDAHAALLGFGVTSEVRSGENRGETLRHDFAALGLSAAPLRERSGRWSARLPLPRRAQAAPKRLGVAVWLTRPGALEPIQTAGGFLP